MNIFLAITLGLGVIVFIIGMALLFFATHLLGLWIATQFIWAALILFFVGVFSENINSLVVFKVAITFFSGFSIFSLLFLSLLTRAQLLNKDGSLKNLRELRR